MSRILYFIGAGLTKALALPTRPIPAMLDFISTSAEYVYDDVILTTLAELENSAPYPYTWVSAAARSLAPRLVGRNRTADPDDRAKFARALRERPGESIEDLLDRTGDCEANPSSKSADARFRYAIRRLFTMVGWEVEWEPLLWFLARQFGQTNSTHTFVSFNYDLILERGVQLAAKGDLDLTRMYGFAISMQVTADPPPSMEELGGGSFSALPVLTLPTRSTSLDISVLKPHGSLNWLGPVRRRYDETESDDLRQGRSVIIPLDGDGALRYLPTTDLPPCVQILGHFPINVEPVIVTPRGAKTADRPFLRETLDKEKAAIMGADEVYILGWSIPRTDADQESMIREMVSKRSAPFRRVTVVNFSASVDYYSRVEEIFGVARAAMRTYNAGFRDFASC